MNKSSKERPAAVFVFLLIAGRHFEVAPHFDRTLIDFKISCSHIPSCMTVIKPKEYYE